MTLRRLGDGVASLVVLVATLSMAGPATATRPRPDARPAAELPLAGRIVVLDPGHQLGNHNFPGRINRLVPAGGFRKPCNTTGTATDRGYAEATFVWEVSRIVQRRLEALGARVVLTRHDNSQRSGGRASTCAVAPATSVGADLKLSIHADGSRAAGARGFHVIAPADRRAGPTTSSAPPGCSPSTSALRCAPGLRPGQLRRRWRRARRPRRPRHPQPVRRAGGDGRARQHAQRPRGAPDGEPAGRAAYAAALVAGVRRYLGG